MKRRTIILLAALAALAIAVAGCGNGSSGGSGGSSSNAAASTSTAPTLYTFAKDTAGKSNCTGECANDWPPAPANAKAPAGVDKQKLGTIKRSDGTRQLALGGHPLYTYIGDKKPGDRNGDGLNVFGGVWTATGTAPKSSSPAPTRSYGY